MIHRWPVVALLLAAAALRLPQLDTRPMHADEAIQADRLVSGPAYDPRDYHGPMLRRLTLIPASRVSETTLRLVTAIAGIFLALSPLLFARWIGIGAAVTAAMMCAVSPALVYYSRFYIPEMLLALLTALFLFAAMRGSWFFAGLAAALMLATKETAVLAVAAVAAAYAASYRPQRVFWRGVGLFLTAPLVLAPPWKWGVLAQAAEAYFERARGGMHAHPWFMYGSWMSITDAPLILAGLAALCVARKPELRFLSWYAMILLAIYSAIPYKTPWCAVSPLYGLALAGGTALQGIHIRWRVLLAVCLAAVAWLSATRYCTDPRNPWVYAQTGPDIYTLRDRIAEFPFNTAIDVYCGENWWPLPWYVRQHPNVHWWRQVPAAGAAAPIVLVSPALEPGLIRKLYEGPPPGERELYMNLFENRIDLRPGVEVRGYVAKSLWDRRATSLGK